MTRSENEAAAVPALPCALRPVLVARLHVDLQRVASAVCLGA